MERRPPAPFRGAHRHIQEQKSVGRTTKSVETTKLTPVFGTAQPPRGVSGLLRLLAYRIPQHLARRWLLLMAADRVDVLGHRVAKAGVPVAFGGIAAGGWMLFRRFARG